MEERLCICRQRVSNTHYAACGFSNCGPAVSFLRDGVAVVVLVIQRIPCCELHPYRTEFYVGVAIEATLRLPMIFASKPTNTYPSQLCPAEANGFSTSTNWIFNDAVVQLAPFMINTISWMTNFVFFCFNLSFIPCVIHVPRDQRL